MSNDDQVFPLYPEDAVATPLADHDHGHRIGGGAVCVFFTKPTNFAPATSHLPQDYEAKIAKLDGVREVVPIQVFTNNCRASLDVIVFYGLPAKKLRAARDLELLSGGWSEFEQHQDSAVVGRAVANRRHLKVGDKFSIGDL